MVDWRQAAGDGRADARVGGTWVRAVPEPAWRKIPSGCLPSGYSSPVVQLAGSECALGRNAYRGVSPRLAVWVPFSRPSARLPVRRQPRTNAWPTTNKPTDASTVQGPVRGIRRSRRPTLWQTMVQRAQASTTVDGDGEERARRCPAATRGVAAAGPAARRCAPREQERPGRWMRRSRYPVSTRPMPAVPGP